MTVVVQGDCARRVRRDSPEIGNLLGSQVERAGSRITWPVHDEQMVLGDPPPKGDMPTLGGVTQVLSQQRERVWQLLRCRRTRFGHFAARDWRHWYWSALAVRPMGNIMTP